jgi:hypothetical protein
MMEKYDEMSSAPPGKGTAFRRPLKDSPFTAEPHRIYVATPHTIHPAESVFLKIDVP